jgi:hypothetical protein
VVVVVPVVVVVAAVVVVVAVVSVVVVPPLPFSGPGHLPPTARELPLNLPLAWAECLLTEMRTYLPLPVLWHISTFLDESPVVVVCVPVESVVLAMLASPEPPLCGLPLPGGGFATAIEATTPATKSVRKMALSFIGGSILR